MIRDMQCSMQARRVATVRGQSFRGPHAAPAIRARTRATRSAFSVHATSTFEANGNGAFSKKSLTDMRVAVYSARPYLRDNFLKVGSASN
eukprot:7847835-Pyramimonas_sp.AAC.1